MWQIAVLVTILTLGSIDAGTSAHGWCLLYKDKCVTHCPRHMHPYYTRCDVETISQRTCTNPIQAKIGFTCGWSRCDCNSHLVLDEDEYTCVELNDCPPQLSRKELNRQRRKQKNSFHVPKHLELNPDMIDLDN